MKPYIPKTKIGWIKLNYFGIVSTIRLAFVLAVGYHILTVRSINEPLWRELDVTKDQIIWNTKADLELQSQINEFAQAEMNNWTGLLGWAKNVRAALEDQNSRITKLEGQPTK